MDHGYTDGITEIPKKIGLPVSKPAYTSITATLDDCRVSDYKHNFFYQELYDNGINALIPVGVILSVASLGFHLV